MNSSRWRMAVWVGRCTGDTLLLDRYDSNPTPGCRKLRRWYFGDEISLLGEMVLNSQWPLLLRPPFYLDRIKYLFSSSNNDYEYLSCRLIRLGLLLISFSLEVLDIANSNSFRPTETHPPRYSFIANYPFYFAAYPWFIAWNKERVDV